MHFNKVKFPQNFHPKTCVKSLWELFIAFRKYFWCTHPDVYDYMCIHIYLPLQTRYICTRVFINTPETTCTNINFILVTLVSTVQNQKVFPIRIPSRSFGNYWNCTCKKQFCFFSKFEWSSFDVSSSFLKFVPIKCVRRVRANKNSHFQSSLHQLLYPSQRKKLWLILVH